MTDGAGGHLSEAARTALELPDDERVARIRAPRWIGYTQALAILGQLQALLDHPKQHRMPNLLLVGDTNNGKTLIAKRFERLHPAQREGGQAVLVPVLVIQAPPVPDEDRFYSAILDALLVPHRSSHRAAQKQGEVIRILRYVGLKVLVVDEIHHVLAGHDAKQRQFLNVVKYLGNELRVPIVGVGIKETVRALQTDPQLANRFEPVALPRWEMNQDYLMLLARSPAPGACVSPCSCSSRSADRPPHPEPCRAAPQPRPSRKPAPAAHGSSGSRVPGASDPIHRRRRRRAGAAQRTSRARGATARAPM
ncbi:MAG: TniB family NTP-binding protein [Thermoanaerobaculaceae bacterium]|nr:TniB family NTP-binding protein [Thermoanaerobaculaceae bacterium]